MILSSQTQRDPRDAYEALTFGLAKTVLYLFEPNRDVAAGLKLALREGGLTTTRSFANPAELLLQLQQNPPDAVILSENADHNIFELAKQVRHGEIGRNPFTVLSMLVSETKIASRDLAVRSGVDAILIKPVQMERIKEQLIRLGRQRLPFIATTDYIGPERRTNNDRPSAIPQIKVVNTLQYRLEGRQIAQHLIDQAVTQCMAQVWESQLQSAILKFHYICKTVAAYLDDQAAIKKRAELIDSFASTVSLTASIGRKLGKASLSQMSQSILVDIAEPEARKGDVHSEHVATLRKATLQLAEAIAACTTAGKK